MLGIVLTSTMLYIAVQDCLTTVQVRDHVCEEFRVYFVVVLEKDTKTSTCRKEQTVLTTCTAMALVVFIAFAISHMSKPTSTVTLVATISVVTFCPQSRSKKGRLYIRRSLYIM